MTQADRDIRIRRLSRHFGERPILDNLDLHIEAGQFVVLLGKSGSGKSTLLRALAGLDDDAQGSGEIQAPEARAVMFQDSRLLPWDSVLGNVTLGISGADAPATGLHALASVGLQGRDQAWPNQLSGGEQQRVALARALVSQPHMLLADEPFGALDALTRLQMQDLLRSVVQRRGLSTVLVTHDVDEALRLADRVVVLNEGRISFDTLIDVEHPRRAGSLEDHRRQLLTCLGVELINL